jgi:hypothetical protein
MFTKSHVRPPILDHMNQLHIFVFKIYFNIILTEQCRSSGYVSDLYFRGVVVECRPWTRIILTGNVLSFTNFMLYAGKSRVRFQMRTLDFSIYLIIPGVDLVSYRNEYQESSWE